MKTLALLVLCAVVSTCLSTDGQSASPDTQNEVFVQRDLASELIRHKRAPRPGRRLTRAQRERLSEICEVNRACEHMAETVGIVAAYKAYYGRLPF